MNRAWSALVLNKMVSYLFVIFAASAFMLSTVNAQVIPDEARRHMARGETAVETAKSPEEYEAAIREFQIAVRLAPKWPDPYYNLGLVQEKAGKFRDAISSLNKYLQVAPKAPDAARVKSLIYKLEYKAEQLLTVPDIIDALVSFSKDRQEWESNGSCAGWWGEHGLFDITHDTSNGENVVKLIYGNIYRNNPKELYESINVTGPVLAFRSVVNVCDESANTSEGGCDAVYENEIKVKSKRIVKLKQKVLRGGSGAGVAGGEQYLCTFRKKGNADRDALELDLAIGSKNRARVESLINNGLDINARNKYGSSPLELAVTTGSQEIVELLITKGADVTASDKDHVTPLHKAAYGGDPGIAALLIANGAEVNARSNDGQTPLFNAVVSKQKKMVELLVSSGADPNVRDSNDFSPLSHALIDNNKEMVELLIAKGTDIDARNKHGQTPLCYAVSSNRKEMAELLIANGADINARDSNGSTLLIYAYSNKEMVELLKKHGAK